MRVHLETVIDMESGEVLVDRWIDYHGPVALCDRALQKTAQGAANTSQQVGKQYGEQASELSPAITGFATGEMLNPQGYGSDLPGMIGAQQQVAGAETGNAEQQARLRAARTGNAAGLAAEDVAAAGNATQAQGQAVQDILNQNAALKEAQRQAGAGALQGMYGTDVGAQLGAMGQTADDVNAGVNAGNSGWFQNTLGLINALKPGGRAGGFSFGKG